ncbi:MAG: response regulator, partial [Gammaproteobacteria bacterium]|nr:response regulator [Gammaproteobacteria bacterium]
MSNRERQVISLLAVDDDPGVLSSYQALFERSRRQGDMDQLEALLNEGSGSSGEDERVERRFPFEFDLDTITQGSEGPALAQQKPYSVALLDMRMPGGWDGLKTAMALHQQDPRIRIILITAFMDYSLDDLRGQLGTNFAYLQKPFDTNELIQLVLLLSHDWLREQQLMEAEQKALRASQSKDDFLASMSHELRTPLTALLGNCDLMGETSLTTSQSELLSSMEVSGKSLLYLINDILDNSKIESGRFDIDEVEYNPLLLIKELREIFSIRASETGILFEVEIENDFERMLV